MFKAFYTSAKDFLKILLAYFWNKRKILIKFFFILFILVAAWSGFLFLVVNRPVDVTSSLIMVWLSAFILICTAFPTMFDRIKKLKWRDFELELREVISSSTPDEFISAVGDEFTFTEKGTLNQLWNVLQKAHRYPHKPVLLIVNIKNNTTISIPMLFMYVYFLDLVNSSVYVLFTSTTQSFFHFTEINKNSIIGTLHSKRTLKIFLRRFPHFSKIFGFTEEHYKKLMQYSLREGDSNMHFDHLFQSLFWELQVTNEQYLSLDSLEELFGSKLIRGYINFELTTKDLQYLKEAMFKDDNLLLIIRENYLYSITTVCRISKRSLEKLLSTDNQSRAKS